jgi:hypothetical protein
MPWNACSFDAISCKRWDAVVRLYDLLSRMAYTCACERLLKRQSASSTAMRRGRPCRLWCSSASCAMGMLCSCSRMTSQRLYRCQHKQGGEMVRDCWFVLRKSHDVRCGFMLQLAAQLTLPYAFDVHKLLACSMTSAVQRLRKRSVFNACSVICAELVLELP